MTNNEEIEESKESIKLVAANSIDFSRKNDLIRVSKRCHKSVDKALTFLEQVVEDDKSETRQRIECAKFIVTMTKELSESVARDQLSRAIAQSRLLIAEQATQQRVSKFAGSGNAENEDEEEDTQPVYVPNMILKNDHISQM